jgi:hypothetical protein
VSNEEGSLDMIDYQVGRGGIPEFQVDKEEEMNSVESSYQQGDMMEEHHRNILIIGGIQIFLPSSPVEAIVCVADATIEEGQPIVTIIEGDTEPTMMFSPAEREEHSKELLTIFSQEDEQEITAAL